MTIPARRCEWPDPWEVDVWGLRLDAPASELRHLKEVISGEERARADRFAFAADRCRYVAAHGLLRHILAGYVGLPPSEMRVERAPEDKPRLVHPGDLCFNLSHSGGIGTVAVTFAREVGIDIEAVRPLDDLEGLVGKCFSAVERTQFATIPESSRLVTFLETWTRKEAFLKALGEGLSRPLDSFDVTLGLGVTPCFRCDRPQDSSVRWQWRGRRRRFAFAAG